MLKKLIFALVPISIFALLTIRNSSAQNQLQPIPSVQPTPEEAHVICAGDTPPQEAVITATGSSPVCPGACRARKIEPISGGIMVICAHQPIPENYTLESVTTSPKCQCLGDQDNAYIIRLSSTATPTATPASTPGAFGESPGSALGQKEEFRVGE